MENSYFPEDKDLAHKIMMDLSNTDLVKLCATNKRMYAICNNYPSFWKKKFIKDYGEQAAKYKPENRSWKTHYLRVFIDLQEFRNDPIKFFKYIAWKENVAHSLFIDAKNQRYSALKDAPEWVMNNLYLLNIDKLKVTNVEGFKEYENIKPIDFFKAQPVLEDYLFGVNFHYYYNTYYPDYRYPQSLRSWLNDAGFTKL